MRVIDFYTRNLVLGVSFSLKRAADDFALHRIYTMLANNLRILEMEELSL
jgi:hypothetical protein